MRLKLSIGNVLYDLRSQNDLICRENHEKKKNNRMNTLQSKRICLDNVYRV